MGRHLRVGAGVGRRHVDQPRPRRRPHEQDPAGHDADATVAAQAVGTGESGRHRRPPQRRPRHARRRPGRDRQRLRRVRRGVRSPRAGRADGRVPRDRLRPVARSALLVLGQALHRRTDRLPDDRPHGADAAGADLVRGRARVSQVDVAGDTLGRPHPAGGRQRRRARRRCRRSPGRRQVRRPSRRSALRHRDRGRADHSPAAWADAGATWWLETQWDAVGQSARRWRRSTGSAKAHPLRDRRAPCARGRRTRRCCSISTG